MIRKLVFAAFQLAIFNLVWMSYASAQYTYDANAINEISCHEATSNTFRIDDVDFSLAPTDGYDLIFIEANWQLSPTGFITGFVNYHFKALQNLDTFFLDCSDSLLIDSVIYSNVIPLEFDLHNNVLSILLPNTMDAGSEAEVEIFYKGTPASEDLGGFMVSSHNGDSIIATLSEPYSSRTWWPSKMSLSDKIDSIDISVRVTGGNKVGANGILFDIDTINQRPEINNTSTKIDTSRVNLVYHWKTRYPTTTYLIGISAYPYAEVTHQLPLGNDTLFMQHYAYPDQVLDIVNYQPFLDSTFQIYYDLFGQYPFINEKYGHAQWNRGGGMEHQTMSFVSEFDNHSLISHELAHQWFGDKITCGSWSDIWLNEGWATYSTGLTYEKLFGGQYWGAFRVDINEHALRDSVNSVFCDDTSDVSRIFSSDLSYKKGACLLHSLRYLLGDDNFFAATKVYLNDTTLAYGFARTVDFKNHLEAFYEDTLTEFFNDWYYGKGYPKLHLYWSQRDAHVACKFIQTSHAHQHDGFVFDMKVPVKFYGDNKDTTIDLSIHQLFEAYNLSIPFTIDSIVIDPELWWVIGDKQITRLDYLVEEGNIHVFPNPFSDQLTIVSSSDETINQLQLFTVEGKLLKTINLPEQDVLVPYILHLENLSNGAYYLRYTTSQSITTIPLIKMQH